MATSPTLTPRQAEILKLARSGLSPRDMAKVTGLTTQRIYQLIARLTALGHLEEEAS